MFILPLKIMVLMKKIRFYCGESKPYQYLFSENDFYIDNLRKHISKCEKCQQKMDQVKDIFSLFAVMEKKVIKSLLSKTS